MAALRRQLAPWRALRDDDTAARRDPGACTARALHRRGRRSRGRGAAARGGRRLRRWPGESNAWLGRGNVAYADGDRAAAADAWSRAIMLDPDDAAARNNLAELLLEAGCLDESRRQVERAAALAKGTSLESAISASYSKIDATARASARCQFEGRVWPD